MAFQNYNLRQLLIFSSNPDTGTDFLGDNRDGFAQRNCPSNIYTDPDTGTISHRRETVEDEYYFKTVIRYIHLNPVKAGKSPAPGDYPYSSYRWIFESGKYSDSDLIFKLFRKKEFEEYHKEKK